MLLSPLGSRDYDLTIKTSPQVSNWEASFDGGTTWYPGTTDPDDDTHFTWLVAGPLCTEADPSAIAIPSDTQPLIRMVGTPEVIVAKTPYITLATPTAV